MATLMTEGITGRTSRPADRAEEPQRMRPIRLPLRLNADGGASHSFIYKRQTQHEHHLHRTSHATAGKCSSRIATFYVRLM